MKRLIALFLVCASAWASQPIGSQSCRITLVPESLTQANAYSISIRFLSLPMPDKDVNKLTEHFWEPVPGDRFAARADYDHAAVIAAVGSTLFLKYNYARCVREVHPDRTMNVWLLCSGTYDLYKYDVGTGLKTILRSGIKPKDFPDCSNSHLGYP